MINLLSAKDRKNLPSKVYKEERLHADQNIDANVVILYWRPFEGQ